MSSEETNVGASPASNFHFTSRLQHELHPLQNYEILSRVFSFCSVKDLKNCRLVGSKLWLKASLNSWREKAVLQIKSQFCRPQPGLEFLELQRIHEENEDVFMMRRKPFRNILLREFIGQIDANHPELSWILEKFSSHLRHVTFENCQFSTVNSFLDIIFQHLPNLVELKLAGRVNSLEHREPLQNIEAFPNHPKLKSIILENSFKLFYPGNFSWETFFRSVPNLENLCIRSRYSHTATEVKQIVTAADSVRREDASKLNIINLEISSVNTKPQFAAGVWCSGPDNLNDVVPRPTKENIAWPMERFTGSMVDVVHLNPYSKTLKFANVFFTKDEEYSDEEEGDEDDSEDEDDAEIDNINDISDEKISLPNVLEFHGHGTPVRVFTNLNKVEAINLETLKVDGVPSNVGSMRWRTYRIIALDNPSLGNVTRLEFYCNSKDNERFTFNVEQFRKLCNSMPNMLHVKMPLTGEVFPILCEKWPELLTLTVLQAWCDVGTFNRKMVGDEAITGILRGKNRTKGGGRLPNITNLKSLTDFVNPYELTDFSINFGFLHLPRLYYLRAKISKVSEAAKSALQRKVEILEIVGAVEPDSSSEDDSDSRYGDRFSCSYQ